MPGNNITIKVADWKKDKQELSRIRRLVFIEEQNVPQAMEWDEFDESSIHFLVTNKNQAIACARLKHDGQIGRMAVLAEYRKQGFGSKLLQFVLDTAKKQNIDPVYLHAQVSAISFYEKLNFASQGNIFYEANIPHREMFKKYAK
jgi:predicted GNAT family N-acyltransferase